MATRAQQAQAAADKAARLQALEIIGAQALPLPTERRDEPVDYCPALAAEAIALGREGLSDAQIADHWGLDLEGLARMADTHQDLKEALSRARTAAVAWYEEKARHALVTNNNRFPAGAWAQITRAIHPERFAERVNVAVLDVAKLVQIHHLQASDVAGLLGERTGRPVEALTDRRTIQQTPSWTVEREPETASVPAAEPGEDPTE